MSIKLLCLILLMNIAHAELNFSAESQHSTRDEKTNGELNTKEYLNNISKKQNVEINFGLSNAKLLKSEIEIRDNLKRYELILSKEKKPETIFTINLNQSVSYLQLARIERIRSGGKTIAGQELDYLNKAKFIIERLLINEKNSSEIQAQLKYFYGIALLDLGLKEISRKSFEEAISINSNASFVPTVTLYLADLLYGENDLVAAKKEYLKFYDRFTDADKDLAQYKLAWIALNQSNFVEAEKGFSKLIEKSKVISIVSDACLSLAVSWSDKLIEQEVLQKVDLLETSESNKAKILQTVYDNFLKDEKKSRINVWKRVLKINKNENDIVRLLSNEINALDFQKKKEQSLENTKTILEYIEKNRLIIQKYSDLNLISLGQDLEILISKMLSVYQKERSDKNYNLVKESIDSYLKFDKFTRNVDLTTLYLDLITEHKDENLLAITAWKILKNPKYQTLHSRCKVIVLLDLERKYQAKPQEYQKHFFNLLKYYLRDEQIENWNSVAGKTFDYYVKASEFQDAEELGEKIFKKNGSDENLLKLMSVKFELKKCNEINEVFKTLKNPPAKLVDYKRECLLSSAKDSKKEIKNFPCYQKNIVEFISLADGAKKMAAVTDYLLTFESYLFTQVVENESKELREQFYKLISEEYYKDRFKSDLFPIYQREIDRLLEKGDFERVLFYLDKCEENVICKDYLVIKNQITKYKNLDLEYRNNKITNNSVFYDNINYISLLYPELVMEKVLAQDSKINSKITLVVSKLEEINWSDDKYKQIYPKFESLLSRDYYNKENLATWKSLSKVNLPVINGPHKYKDKDILFFINKVQITRKNLVNDLPKVSLENQKEILLKASEIEKQMALIIENSPVPKNLDISKKDEYLEGLKNLSKEFHDQFDSYAIILKKIDSELEQKARDNEKVLIAKKLDNINEWNFGSDNNEQNFVKMLVEENYFTAYFYIDYLNSAKKISLENYYFKKAGMLFWLASKRNHVQGMYDYMINELNLNKVDSVVKYWQERNRK